MTAEEQRTRLIGDIARILRESSVPDEARAAALTLIGWLARRMPGEPVSFCDPCRCTGNGIARHGGAASGPTAPRSSVARQGREGEPPPSSSRRRSR